MMELLKGNETVKPTTNVVVFQPYVKKHYISTDEIMRIEILGSTAIVHLRHADEYGMNKTIKLDNDEELQKSIDNIMDRPFMIMD